MESSAARREKLALSAPNTGLESLAAEASRRAESLEAMCEAGASMEVNDSKAASQTSGHKGKVRKAYTITKQRERWSDGEHDRFLQALKRYGRAWRKIEEHIGTKTAVQIRSHAQKFFSKLQREQSANGGIEESSKSGISIPPPRPKRKPVHPYPRKNESTDIGSSQQQLPLEQPSTSQPSFTPTKIHIPNFPTAELSEGEPSLAQVLEAAAVAAATAWSQVVASAGSKVQQQLEAHVTAKQNLQTRQAVMGMNPTVLYQMAQKQAAAQSHAANLQSSSQHPVGRDTTAQGGPNITLTGTSAPNIQQSQSMQDSLNGAGNAAGQGNDRDSACSREFSRGQAPSLDRLLTNRQLAQGNWPHSMSPGLEPRGARVSRESAQLQLASAASSQLTGSLQNYSASKQPSRAFSSGAALNGETARSSEQSGLSAQRLKQEPRARNVTAQSHSDTSQLANYFQQAAAEERKAGQDNEQGENGSSGGEGEGDGSSGGGSNEKVGMRSDKGSNAGNSGSDEDANGNGSDNGANDPAEPCGPEFKGPGSDDGSNSPGGRKSLPSTEPENPPQPSAEAAFKLRLPASSPQRQQQTPPPLLAGPHPRSPQAMLSAGSVLSPEAMVALQQQAISAWVSNLQQPPLQQGFQLLHGLLNNMSAGRAEAHHPPVVHNSGAELSVVDRRSSEAPSMDTFNSRALRSSHSAPLGVAAGQGSGGHKDRGDHATSEEASGFKPYNKRQGMAVASLPLSKRFAAAASEAKDGTPVSNSIANGGQPGCYSPFGITRNPS